MNTFAVHRGAPLRRTAWGIGALLAAAALGQFILVHPLGRPGAGLVIAAVLAAMVVRPNAWLLLLPALLPVADLAPWTGHVFVTESDALVLCALVAACGREAVSDPAPDGGAWRLGATSLGLIGWMALSYAVSTPWSPLMSLGSDPNLLAGYDSELNGVRLAKAFVFALALLPALATAYRRDAEGAGRALASGIVASIALVSLATIWERIAFPGFSDFSSEYRTTALFWEMNVGGAQLDGWLAIGLPFATWSFLRAGSIVRQAVFGLVLVLSAYAVFTTFSRGLYAAAAAGALLLTWALVRGRVATTGSDGARVDRRVALTWALFALAAAWALAEVFKAGGYRAMAAVTGLALAVYVVGPLAASTRAQVAVPLLGFAAVLTAGIVHFSLAAKWVYFAYGAAATLVIGLAMAVPRLGAFGPSAALAALSGLAASAILVAVHWGGDEAVGPAALAGVLVLIPMLLARSAPAMQWRPSARGAALLLAAIGAAALVAVTFNTYYAANRLSTVGKDLTDRRAHWARSIDLVAPDEQWLGIGTGRYAAAYYWHADGKDVPGNHRLGSDADGTYLRLGGPKYAAGYGELYRVMQRIDGQFSGPMKLSLRARSPGQAGAIVVEVCRRHLIYPAGCATATIHVPASGDWQSFSIGLDPGVYGRSPGFPPRLTAFSLANAKQGQVLDVDGLQLVASDGRELVANGQFEQGIDRWFFTSDRHHLPWHAKNVWLHYWIEQGWLGAIAFSAVLLAAVIRLTRGRASGHPLSPPLLAGLVGFLVVGAFDSLVDAPRLTLLLFLVVFVALGLRGGADRGPDAGSSSGRDRVASGRRQTRG